jgi:hypothetical protein
MTPRKPKRLHPRFENFIIYTTATGGTLRFVAWGTRELYEEMKRTGKLNVTPLEVEPTWVDLKMVAWAPCSELHDFAMTPPTTFA